VQQEGRGNDDDDDAIPTTSSIDEPARPVNAPLPSAIRNKGSSGNNKIARHFDDMPAAQSHPPSSSAAAKAPGGFKNLMRRLSGSGREQDRNKPGIWKTEAEVAAERRREREVESMGMQNKLQKAQPSSQPQPQPQSQAQPQTTAQMHGQTRGGWIDGATSVPPPIAGSAQGQAQAPLPTRQPSANATIGDVERERMRAREEADGIDDGYADDGAVGRNGGGSRPDRRRSWKAWR